MNVRLSWAQHIVLKAASKVDHLPFRARDQINVSYGVWRSLVILGYLRQVPTGWEITEEGRERLDDEVPIRKPRQETRMEGKLPRYCVQRIINGWALVERKKGYAGHVIETLDSREKARAKARALNLAERQADARIQAALAAE